MPVVPVVRRLAVTVGAAVAIMPVVTVPAHAAPVAHVWLSSYDSRMLADINHARAAANRRPLTVAAGTTDVAHAWSCAMARHNLLSHRSNLVYAITHRGSAAWGVIGENVGMSSSTSADVLFQAYMHSPEHRANILDRDYRYLGIRTKRVAGISWNTLDFVDAYNNGYGPARVRC